nr:unnamed protein product [Callosobruchus chinensis]
MHHFLTSLLLVTSHSFTGTQTDYAPQS